MLGSMKLQAFAPLLALLALLAPLALPLQEAPAPAGGALALERPGDGSPVCGLGKAFHAGRRAALRERLEQGLVLVRGLPESRDYVRFAQDKVFWYLTGVESPDATLVMDAASGREVLLLPRADPRKEVWEGELWDASDAWVSELTGIAEVRPLEELDALLDELLAGEGKRVWISTQPHVALSGCFDRARPYDRHVAQDPLDGRPSREDALKAALERDYGADVRTFTRELDAMRLVKQPEELAAMRRAGRAGALAMAEAMRSTRAGLGEWELESLMAWQHVREGARGPAYLAIVGSGPNALVLHYGASARTMADGEVVLIDFAPELDHFTSDITRTWPVSGAFSARQAELYDAVLAAQAAGIAAVKPGVRLADVEAACAKVLTERGFGELQRHGACHWIGMEVHDVGSYATRLEPGMAFTVEPGLYEPATDIGIRIEDVVVVTDDGCEVITDLVPKERAAIESLVGAEGILDRLDGAR